jgi:hypothetical protein
MLYVSCIAMHLLMRVLLYVASRYSAVMTESQGAAIPTSASVNALLYSKMLAMVSSLCLLPLCSAMIRRRRTS